MSIDNSESFLTRTDEYRRRCYPFENVVYYGTIERYLDHSEWSMQYVRTYSIISYFPATFIYQYLKPVGKIIMLTDEEKNQVERLFLSSTDKPVSQQNIMFVLVESLESWPLKSVCGYDFMPNLSALLNNEHVLYCDKVTSQVKYGNSADGQLIDVTGCLPISDGVTCTAYSSVVFPSYADCVEQSAIINPWPNCYNQGIVTYKYQFKELIEPQSSSWGDDKILGNMITYADTALAPFCVFGITASSHMPFSYGAKHPAYIIDGMPTIMNDYLNSLHYTDSCIGALFEAIQNNERLRDNTTIVIAGDHNIFRTKDNDIDQFAQEHQIDMQTTHTFTPLIIYSPNIGGNIQIADTCYQMDIYPTIMPLIGCEDYYWKGVGVNLLDSAARHNRMISEQEAYYLSDKLIRSNYFAPYHN